MSPCLDSKDNDDVAAGLLTTVPGEKKKKKDLFVIYRNICYTLPEKKKSV